MTMFDKLMTNKLVLFLLPIVYRQTLDLVWRIDITPLPNHVDI